jgi:hypothetical protein
MRPIERARELADSVLNPEIGPDAEKDWVRAYETTQNLYESDRKELVGLIREIRNAYPITGFDWWDWNSRADKILSQEQGVKEKGVKIDRGISKKRAEEFLQRVIDGIKRGDFDAVLRERSERHKEVIKNQFDRKCIKCGRGYNRPDQDLCPECYEQGEGDEKS